MDYMGGCKFIFLVVTGGCCCYGPDFMHRGDYPTTVFLAKAMGYAEQVL